MMDYTFLSEEVGMRWIVGWFLFCVVMFAAWVTHVVVCLKAATWGFLIAGAIFFPVGIVHGIGLWFGAF